MRYKAYPKYKDSGVEWLGQVPEHWEVKRLRFLAKVNPTSSDLRSLDGDTEVSFVPMECISEYGGMFLEQTKPYEDVKNGYTYFKNGDVLFAKITPCFENGKGSVAENLVNDIGFGTTELHVIRPCKELDKKFLFYLTISSSFRKIGEASMYGAGGQKRVPTEFVKDFYLPVTGLQEQKTIAEFLDHETTRIDTLIEKNQRMVELLQEKRTAVISHAVTKGLDPDVKKKDSGVEWMGQVPEQWYVKKIKWIASVLRGASPRPIDDPVYFDEDGEYAWVRISDVTSSGMYLEETTQKLSDIGASLSVKLMPGEVFLSIAGSVGKPCINSIKCCIHDGFVYFPHSKMNNKYIYYIFASGEPYKGLGKLGTQLNLNTETVGSIKIGVTSDNEQKAIADFLDRETARIDALIQKTQQAIDTLREYRNALISSAVTGKIDVRG